MSPLFISLFFIFYFLFFLLVPFLKLFPFFSPLDVFAAFHPPSAYALLSKYCVGELNEEEKEESEFLRDVRKLRAHFKELGYFKSSKLYYCFKVFSNSASFLLIFGVCLLVCVSLFLQRTSSKKTKMTYQKVLSNLAILSSSLALMTFFPGSIVVALLSGFLVALFWQQCGWLSHDFLHHQVFENRFYNDLTGLFSFKSLFKKK